MELTTEKRNERITSWNKNPMANVSALDNNHNTTSRLSMGEQEKKHKLGGGSSCPGDKLEGTNDMAKNFCQTTRIVCNMQVCFVFALCISVGLYLLYISLIFTRNFKFAMQNPFFTFFLFRQASSRSRWACSCTCLTEFVFRVESRSVQVAAQSLARFLCWS